MDAVRGGGGEEGDMHFSRVYALEQSSSAFLPQKWARSGILVGTEVPITDPQILHFSFF